MIPCVSVNIFMSRSPKYNKASSLYGWFCAPFSLTGGDSTDRGETTAIPRNSVLTNMSGKL
jgi:hypothetical protein